MIREKNKNIFLAAFLSNKISRFFEDKGHVLQDFGDYLFIAFQHLSSEEISPVALQTLQIFEKLLKQKHAMLSFVNFR